MTRHVMPCPEGCERSYPVHGCERILRAPAPDGSCWRCGGVGFVDHDGSPDVYRTELGGERQIPTPES